MKRDMNGKLLSRTEAGEDIVAPIVQTILKSGAVLQRNDRLWLRSGTIKRTQQNQKVVLRVPIGKFGGSAKSAAMSGKHLQTADFAGAAVRLVQKNSAASFLVTHNIISAHSFCCARLSVGLVLPCSAKYNKMESRRKHI